MTIRSRGPLYARDNDAPALAEISRVRRPRAEARASYDRLSKIYDLLAGRSEGIHRDVGLRMLDARDGERVLEIGFGTGHGLAILARAVGACGQVCGIDLATGMCRVAQRRLAQAGLSDRVSIACGDAVALPYPAEAFGAILMSFALELFDTPEIPRVLRECRRVLTEDSRICVVALSRVKVNVATWLYERTHAAFPAFVDCRPIYLRRTLEDAGFQIAETVQRSMWGLPVEIVLAQVARE
jgi:demethylmenaquinone methyltransferase/2-methoxy-6-polyprenyl-1,4-benzoquinol methylase